MMKANSRSEQSALKVCFNGQSNRCIDYKLGHGFTSVDELEEIYIGPRDRPRPTYVSAKLDPEYKQELVDLLKEFKDCFAWEYYEMPGLDRSIVEHRLLIKPEYRSF